MSLQKSPALPMKAEIITSSIEKLPFKLSRENVLLTQPRRVGLADFQRGPHPCVNTRVPDQSPYPACLAGKRRWRTALPPPAGEQATRAARSGKCAGLVRLPYQPGGERWHSRHSVLRHCVHRTPPRRRKGWCGFDRGYHALMRPAC